MKSSSVASFRSRARCAGLGIVCFASGLGGLSAADWQSLLSNSPFGQAPQAAPQNTGGELEFRGVVCEPDVTLVNIFNTATQKSQWIPLEGQANGIAIDSYDATSDKLKVTMGGKALTLTLKQSRVALVQAPPPPPVGAPPPGGGEVARAGQPMPPQAQPGAPAGAEAQQAFRNLPPEARTMIEEIRRRRALRAQQAQQPAAQPQAQPAPTSQP